MTTFRWPGFARHLTDGRPRGGLTALLNSLAETNSSESRPRDLFAWLFDSSELAVALSRETVGFHHVGIIAPAGLDVTAAEGVLARSAFHRDRRTFTSTVLAKDMSGRLGRPVELTVVMGRAATPASWAAAEIFVSNLPAVELNAVVASELGCHVAVELSPTGSFERVAQLLHHHGCREIPLMQAGPLTNSAIFSRLLYFDVLRDGRIRRLEFIAPTSR